MTARYRPTHSRTRGHRRLGAARPLRSPADPQAVFERTDARSGARVMSVRAVRDLDIDSAAAARTELTALVNSPGTHRSVTIVLNADVFVDLHGLQVLRDATSLARACRRTVRVVAPPRSLRRMLDLFDLSGEITTVVSSTGASSTGVGRQTGEAMPRLHAVPDLD